MIYEFHRLLYKNYNTKRCKIVDIYYIIKSYKFFSNYRLLIFIFDNIIKNKTN